MEAWGLFWEIPEKSRHTTGAGCIYYMYIYIYIIHCDGSIHVTLLNVLKHLCNMMKFLKEMLLMFGFLVASSPTYI